MTEPLWPVLTEYVRRRSYPTVAPDLTPEAPEWMKGALCAQFPGDLWYPTKGGSNVEAKRVCRSCVVKVECLQYALDTDDAYGIYAGTTPLDRRRMRPGHKRSVLCPYCGRKFTGTGIGGHLATHGERA